jgi:DNA gyrase subunit A
MPKKEVKKKIIEKKPSAGGEIGYIKKRSITEEMKESYLDYAMSVIISRALPDVRDGLKPVHRRILYAMHKLGLNSGAKYRKSATIVGETLGKYHPHGDLAVYEAMVKLAQSFHVRYPLVDGQGNWGSIDGDASAAMRYTEAKMTKIAEEMLSDIDKETVDWVDNYDGTRKEPTVLPTKLPQLLLNGTFGIAVGMATSIPPHNLGEIVDALVYLIDHSQATVKDFFQFIKGPDFPTGGEIYDRQTMIQAYSAGRGPIINRAKAEIIEVGARRFQIIINEMTYGVNKAALIAKIADLVKDKRIQGIKDIRDESDKEGIRVVIELKGDVSPRQVLNRLYKMTDLQKTFHLNMLALVNGIQPRVLSLKSVLEEYLKHRQEVVTRRTRFELRQAKERAHILMGLAKALDHIDTVIETIKKSADRETAHKNLVKKFKLTDRQAEAILEMRLQTLAGLERKKIKDELKEKKALIKELEVLLKSKKKILTVIKNELKELKEKYADERKTKVFVRPIGQLTEEELVPKEECIIILTQGGYIKRVNPAAYRAQRRGGKGIVGIVPREEDAVGWFIPGSTHDNVLFFTDQGRVFQAKAYEIPEVSRLARGQAIVNILQLGSDEQIAAVLAVSKSDWVRYLVMATENGIIKRTKIEDFAKVRRNGLIAIRLKKDDKLKWAQLTSGQNEIFLTTAKGQSIRFKETDIRPMSRAASGVKGISLREGDKLVRMDVIDKKKEKDLKVLVVTENGFGKKTYLKNYKLQKRGGLGIKTARLSGKTGDIIASQILGPEKEDLIAISQKGQVIRIKLRGISSLGRTTQGVKVMKVNRGDKVASIACI